MSARKFNLNVPSLVKKKSDPSRAASRTDQLVEASFSSENSPVIEISSPKSSNSLKSIHSITRLREVLSKTSEKLSVYSGRPESSASHQDLIEKNKEISELKQQIRVLQLEKKELQNEYNRLAQASQNLREPVLDSDVASIKILKLSNELVGKLNNGQLKKSFLDVVGSENDFFLQLKSENFKFSLLGMLEFMCDVLENQGFGRKEVGGNEGQKGLKSFSSLGDEDYFRLIEESEVLAKTISSQKVKISQVCEKVRETMKKSGRELEPGFGRSYTSMTRGMNLSPNSFRNMIIEENDEDKH